MIKTTLDIIKALFSDTQLKKLYDDRQALRPSTENRTRLSMTITGIVFAAIFVFLMSMAWSYQSADNYIKSRTKINLTQSYNKDWQIAGPIRSNCYDCYRSLMDQLQIASPLTHDLSSFNPKLPPSLRGENQVAYLIRRQFVPDDWSNLLTSRDKLVIHLPKFQYEKADVYFRGEHRATLFNNARIALPFDVSKLDEGGAFVEVVFKVPTHAFNFFNRQAPGLNLLEKNVAVMTLAEERRYESFLSTNRAGRGDFIGAIARVVMAVFVLILFMIIDGSPETLALSLFLGFEGLAISTSYGWLPFENHEFIRHFCFQMGDIFRLYFFLQLARIVDKNVVPWIMWGAALSVPYGLLRYYGSLAEFTWLNHISTGRDFVIGAIGTIVCVRCAQYLWNKRLPWRVAALAVAGIASFEQTVQPLSEYVPIIAEIPGFQAFVNIMQPASAWLIAFSAFINISTLENRVAHLSEIATRAKTIEKEMELARSVQQAFLNLPTLPPDVQLVCHHEAMLYVSGDTYFADWNERHNRLTFLINDVTGHGIQAALKASGVSVIASTVWNQSDAPGRIQHYARLVQAFFARMNTTPDIVAMGGGEFNLATGEVTLYRQNFPFPVLIAPKARGESDGASRKDDTWSVQLLTIPNDTNVTMSLTPGTFIVFTSDGFMESSRVAHDFMRHLRKHLGNESPNLSADKVKKLILDCNSFKTDFVPDDRTLTVFQWKPNSVTSRQPLPSKDAA